jgi:RNA 2',3'-cyclic 3'-phosphodiesterase
MKTRHRVFVAINLPEKIKNQLSLYQQKWSDLPAKWVKKENLHITLEFLGYLTDEEIVELCQKTKQIAQTKKLFNLVLDKICYGPINKKQPKMVWAVGPKIKQFNLSPHCTLARIKSWQFKQMEIDQRPEINQDINLTFPVDSIQVMESQIKKNNPEYTILENCLFSD